jgi:hypothetical protein
MADRNSFITRIRIPRVTWRSAGLNATCFLESVQRVHARGKPRETNPALGGLLACKQGLRLVERAGAK